jgi:hypothetical protein
MGHDFVKFCQDGERFNDFDLWTLRHFFIEAARAVESMRPSSDTIELRRFFENWEWLGPGVLVGTDLAGFVMDQRRRWELLFEVLQEAADRVSGFGAQIPHAYLAEHINTRTASYTHAVPTQPILACIGRISKLLSRHEPKTA